MKTALQFLIVIFSLFPLRLVHATGALIGWAFILIPNKRRRIVSINLKLCFPEMTDKQRSKLARDNIIEVCKGAVEVSSLWRKKRRTLEKMLAGVSGEKHLQSALEKKNGVILVIPHLGAWEMMGLSCSLQYPMATLYRQPRITGMDETIRTARERFGAKLITTNAGGIRSLLHALNRGEICTILPDQSPQEGSGIFVPFFDIQAYTMSLLPRLMLKTNASVVFGYAERLPQGKGFWLHFLPSPEGAYEETIKGCAQYINEMIERCIRKLPAQYLWSYKRFRTQPHGAPSPYSNSPGTSHQTAREIPKPIVVDTQYP